MPLYEKKDDQTPKVPGVSALADRANDGMLKDQFVVSLGDKYQIPLGDVSKFLQGYLGCFESALDDEGFASLPALDRTSGQMTTIKVDLVTLGNMHASVETLMGGGLYAGAYTRGQIPPSDLGM